MKIIKYHVFTDNWDDYLDTQKEAYQWIQKRKDEGYYNLRIWEMIFECANRKEFEQMDEPTEEDCIFSEGSFPQ